MGRDCFPQPRTQRREMFLVCVVFVVPHEQDRTAEAQTFQRMHQQRLFGRAAERCLDATTSRVVCKGVGVCVLKCTTSWLFACVCVFFTLNRSFTRRYPAHPVSVLILHPRKISSVVTSYDTEIMHRNAFDNAMSCPRTGYVVVWYGLGWLTRYPRNMKLMSGMPQIVIVTSPLNNLEHMWPIIIK